MGKTKLVLWDVPNKISKFENRFPGLFHNYSPKELTPSEVQKKSFFSLLRVIKVPTKNSISFCFNYLSII